MSDGGDSSSFGKWTPAALAVVAIIKAFTGDASVAEQGQEFTHLNAEATFGVIGIVREDLQRQLDQQQEEIDELKAELDRLR